MKTFFAALALSAVSIVGLPTTVGASQLLSPNPLPPIVETNNDVVQVRRCHRGFQRHYSRRYGRRTRHRHVGPRCRATKRDFDYYEDDYRPRRRHPRSGCIRIGNILICD